MKRILLFGILMISMLYGRAQNEDIRLLRDINLHRDRGLDGSFKFITNSSGIISATTPVALISTGLITKDKELLHKGLYVGATWLTSAILANGIKVIVRRDRPFVTYPDIEKLASGGSYSFPSGHSSEAFSIATSLSISFPKWYVVAPAYLWAGLVGYSRMDLGVHYPTDVLAGAVLGAGSAYLCHVLDKRLFRRKERHQ